MFKIVYIHKGSTTENTLYEPGNKDYALTECTLSMAVKKSGDLTMELPLSNKARNSIVCLTDEVVFYRKNVELWRGRIITKQEDFYKYGTLECEGCLSYFCDTVYPSFQFEGTPNELFVDIVMNHNEKADSYKRFTVGSCTVRPAGNILRSSEKPLSSLEALNNKLQDSTLGGFLKVRTQNGTKYIDYVSDYSTNATQVVQFGKNLLDVANKIDYSSVVTALYPIGAKTDDVTDEEGMIVEEGKYLTVDEVNGGSPYVSDSSAVGMYGWICEMMEFSDITVAENLLSKAREELAKITSPIQTLEVTFFDMALVSDQDRSFYLGDQIQVTSSPHGINQRFMLTEMKVLPLAPEKSTLTFGSVKSLSGEITKRTHEAEELVEMERRQRRNAYEGLQRSIAEGSGFFVTEEKDSQGGTIMYVHNKKSLKDSTYVMRINSESVGLSTDGGKNYPYGMNVEGDLVMNAIQATGIDAEYIYINGQEGKTLTQFVADIGEVSALVRTDGSTGILRLGEGGDGTVKFTVKSDNFNVDEDGNVTMKGQIDASSGRIGTDADWFEIEDEGLTGYRKRGVFRIKFTDPDKEMFAKTWFVTQLKLTGNSGTFNFSTSNLDQGAVSNAIRQRNDSVTSVQHITESDGVAYLQIETRDLSVKSLAALMKIGTSISSYEYTINTSRTVQLHEVASSSSISYSLSAMQSTGTELGYNDIKTEEGRFDNLYTQDHTIAIGTRITNLNNIGAITKNLSNDTTETICSFQLPAGTWLINIRFAFGSATGTVDGNGSLRGWAGTSDSQAHADAIAGSNAAMQHVSGSKVGYTLGSSCVWTSYGSSTIYIRASVSFARSVTVAYACTCLA